MHYASLENISKSFGIRELFSGLTFHIEEGDKIALVARNGFGKSTLLRILCGKDTADSGTVWIHKDIRIVMLEQESSFDTTKNIRDNILAMDHPTVQLVKEYEAFVESGSTDHKHMEDLVHRMELMDAWNFEAELKVILGKLQITDLQRSIQSLSGGQVKRVALAQALVQTRLYEGKCLLIMDEPTNHLDIEMIEWLENYLAGRNTTMLMVTHDRYFLDAVCNEIIEIENRQVFIHKGDYQTFLSQKAHRLEVQHSELLKDKNIFRKELEWMRKQPRARTTKSKARQDAFGAIEDRVKQKVSDPDIQLQVKMSRMGGKVLEMKKVYKSYRDRLILKGFDYTFKKGERIGIIGKNGVGKSTFINIALQLQPPDSGKVNHGDTIIFGHFSQDGLQYREDKRVIEYVKDMAEFFPLADGSKLSASKFLETFAFTPEQQYTYLSKLSGGEKRRLQLLSILFKNPNFLVLDEPTNDLDLQTLQLLEEFLQEYRGCILIISHDRYFMDKLVDHLFVFEGDGVIRDFPGTYSQYRQRLEEEKLRPPVPAINNAELVMVAAEGKKEREQKLSFNERREFEKLEKELPELEEEKMNCEAQLAREGLPYDEVRVLSERIVALISKIEEGEMRWLELSERSGN